MSNEHVLTNRHRRSEEIADTRILERDESKILKDGIIKVADKLDDTMKYYVQ